MDVEILPLTSTDLPTVTTFQPDGWPDITKAYSYYIPASFCNPIKMKVGSKIIGLGNSIVFDTTAWLSQIIISADYRSQGFGKLMTKYLIDLLPARINSVNLVATDMGYPLYKKLGFNICAEYLIYFHDLSPIKGMESAVTSEDKFMYYDESHRFILEDLDYKISGECRSNMLDRQNLMGAKLYIHEDQLIGYSVPNLGDGLIVSTDVGLGLRLMARQFNDKRKLAFPSDNISAMKFMEQVGIKPFRKAYRMTLGNLLKPKLEHIYSRIGGNLG